MPMKTHRLTRRGYRETCYTSHDTDAIAAYCRSSRHAYLLPISEVTGRSLVHLRLAAPRNNRASGIRWARDYELATTVQKLGARPTVRNTRTMRKKTGRIRRPGAIAQLGERRAGSAKVAGSSPASSMPEDSCKWAGFDRGAGCEEAGESEAAKAAVPGHVMAGAVRPCQYRASLFEQERYVVPSAEPNANTQRRLSRDPRRFDRREQGALADTLSS